nr:hypothetical protein [Tanacetum cinerariifolium]
MQAAPLLVLDVPREARVQYLAADYGRHDAGALASAVLRLRKRLGGLVTKEALGAIAENDMVRMVELVLAYYDKSYGYGLEGRKGVTHDGFDGLMVGHPQAPYHLEFTSQAGHVAERSPSPEHLLVFYYPEQATWEAAVAQLRAHGYQPVPAHNPYWDQQGLTFEDPD